MRRGIAIAVFAAAVAALTPAHGEDLVSGLSQDQIEITSNYTGTDLVVFGAIEASGLEIVTAQPDVVVVVRGPDVDMTVRKKDRVAGVWINRHEVKLGGMPGYYYLASTRPLDKIAPASVLRRYQLGTDNVQAAVTSPNDGAPKVETYTAAAIRQQVKAGLYRQAPGGVEFLSNSLFRVRVPVPAAVPRGQYTAQVYLFRNGNIVSAQSTPLFVDQIGLERRLFSFAHKWPLSYGFSVVAMALMLGWISSIVFRRA